MCSTAEKYFGHQNVGTTRFLCLLDYSFPWRTLKNNKEVSYLEYSCGYGEEYQVWISYLPNSITEGQRTCGSGGPVTPTFYARGKKPLFFHEFPSERLLRLNKSKHFYLHSPSCSNSLVIRKMQMLLSDTKNKYQSHFNQPCESQKERINTHYHTMYLHYH